MIKRVKTTGIRTFTAIVAVVMLAIVCLPSAVWAQNAGQGLEISPPLLDLKADPGQTITTQIKVRNVTKDTLIVKPQFEDFVASGEDGQPKILLDSNEKSPYSIKDWLSTSGSLTLASQERVNVTVTIVVPKDAGPGGHYGVVRFTGTPPELEGSGVSLSASVGTLILVRVSGDIKQSAKVVELSTGRNGKRGSFFEYGPIDITARVQNTGNIHLQPKGTLQVTNMFGKNVFVGQLNQDSRNVLPGSIRKFQSKLDKKLMFGRYTIRADFVYGTDNQMATAQTTFWVIPYKLIAIIVLVIALIVFAFKQYNKFIINRAGKKSGAKKDKTKKKSS